MNQLGFFDFDIRLSRIDKAGDPLVKLNEAVDWEIFRPALEEAKKKPVKSNAGAKGYDSVMMFKVLILQSLGFLEKLPYSFHCFFLLLFVLMLKIRPVML